jgi:2-C-methyl-D-erythritol 4-phosphate cytidylyltransferase
MDRVTDDCDIWAVIPAAGIGTRMQSDIPKQYLELAGRPVIEHTINRLLNIKQTCGAVVALQADDPYWSDIHIDSDKPVIAAVGGEQRCHSVMNALDALTTQADYSANKAWALVHDAVRPCVSSADIHGLIEQAAGTESGGLLAVPVRDTMKRQDDDQHVAQTVDRTGLWHALTPQLFACVALYDALGAALQAGVLVTDESSAMEFAGYRPLLVEGNADNIKITRPADLRLAELYLRTIFTEPDKGDDV